MVKNQRCTWDSSKHNGQACPHHSGGGQGKYRFRIYIPVKEADGKHGEYDKSPQGKTTQPIEANSLGEAIEQVLQQYPDASITKVTYPDGKEEDFDDTKKKYETPEYKEPDVKTPENREKIMRYLQKIFGLPDHAYDDEWWNRLSNQRVKDILKIIGKEKK